MAKDPTLADVLDIFARHVNWDADPGEKEIVDAYIGLERATEPNREDDTVSLTPEGEQALLNSVDSENDELRNK